MTVERGVIIIQGTQVQIKYDTAAANEAAKQQALEASDPNIPDSLEIPSLPNPGAINIIDGSFSKPPINDDSDTIKTICGNGTIETGEECDPPDLTQPYNDCKAMYQDKIFCGNDCKCTTTVMFDDDHDITGGKTMTGIPD